VSSKNAILPSKIEYFSACVVAQGTTDPWSLRDWVDAFALITRRVALWKATPLALVRLTADRMSMLMDLAEK